MKNPELVSLFKTVRRKIQREDERYICWAIDNSEQHDALVRLNAKQIIHNRLAPWHSYEQWVYTNHPPIYSASVHSNGHKDNCRRGRVAWLNSLIKEFS